MKKNTNENFIKKAIQIHNNKYDYSLVNYAGNRLKIKIICSEHGMFEQISGNHIIGQGCPKCVGFNKTTEEFIKKANYIHNNKYDYCLVNYVNAMAKIDILCKEHGIFKQIPVMHLSGRGCPICGIEKNKICRIKTLDDFIKDAKTVHDEKYDYSLVNYEKSSKKVIIICKKHGKFNQTPNNHLRGAGCPICKESKGERNIRNYLVKNKINFIQEKVFDDCKNKESLFFDFHLPDYNLLIEYDGELHFKNVKFFGGNKGLLYRINNDNIKNNYVLNNSLKLLRIKYSDYENIDNILNHMLKKEL